MDEAALTRKLTAARAYHALHGEVQSALSRHGPDAFRTEYLQLGQDVLPDEAPFYERFGAERVAGGRYSRVIRLREHVAPVAAALAGFAHGS